MSEGPKARICVGAIAGAFGVRGEARLKPFTQTPEDIAAYGPVESEDGARRYDIKITRIVKGGLAARLSGVSTREEAEALKGVRLYVDRAALPDLGDEEEYYHADLIGLTVEDLSGQKLGRVAAVWDFGAGDVLELQRPGAKNAFLPFTREVVPHVDLASGKMTADPPEGALDSGEPPEKNDLAKPPGEKGSTGDGKPPRRSKGDKG